MPRYLDIQTWNRRELFHFFKSYEQPFFNICAEVEVTTLRQYVKAHQLSFFVAALYLSTKAANAIESFRYRLRGEQVLVHEVLHAGSTVLQPNEAFTFCYFDYTANFAAFHATAKEKLAQITAGAHLFEPREERDDLLHYSMIPWISFTSFAHARRLRSEDSVPKIVFGKYYEAGGTVKMPVSVEVHHALLDGLHIGKFFALFENYLAHPAASLLTSA